MENSISIPSLIERQLRNIKRGLVDIESLSPIHSVEDDGTTLTSFVLMFADMFVETIRHQSPAHAKDVILMVGDICLEGNHEDWPLIVRDVLTRVQKHQTQQ